MRIIAYTGKGGVGKSVISCATAIKLAKLGYKTLLASSDPAHTLSDALLKPVGSVETKVADNLWAVQVDPIKEVMEHYSVVIEYLAEVFKAKEIDEALAYELANFPGTTGVATLLKAHSYHKKGGFDALVMDLVPSGEALRLLYVPHLIGRFSRKVAKLVAPVAQIGRFFEPLIGVPPPPGEVIDREVALLERLDAVREMLTNPKVTSMRLVMNPDAFSTSNALRALMQASLYGINVDLAIINKVIPPEVSDPYFEGWIKAQKEHIEAAKASLEPIPVKQLKLYRSELRGFAQLEEAAEELFDGEDPSKVYYVGKPMEVAVREDGVEMDIPAPYAKKDGMEVERVGDELIIHIHSESGALRILIPLPAAAFKYSLKSAKLINGRLHIKFSRE
jgi:arsenite-transporting ATPase